MAKFGSEYFDNNPQNKVKTLDKVITNVPKKATSNLDEKFTHISRSEIIKKVFENKAKSIVEKNKMKVFEEGDEVTARSIYTPYEFLHELLPQVYARANGNERYIVSDEEGAELQKSIDEAKLKLNTEIEEILEENGADSIYELEPEVIEDLNKKRRDLENQEIFITDSELQAYILTNPQLNPDNYIKEITKDISTLKDMGLVCYDWNGGNPRWVYKYQYISGNLYTKKTELTIRETEYKEHLTDDQYEYQKKLINDNIPQQSEITEAKTFSIFINAYSHFAQDKDVFSVSVNDFDEWDVLTENVSLAQAFEKWIDYAENEGIILPKMYKGMDKEDIKNIYVNGEKPKVDRKAFVKGAEGDKLYNKAIANEREKAQRVGQPLFDLFLIKGLNAQGKLRLKIEWNTRFNAFVLPIMHKTPVALTLGRYFKKDIPFYPNPTQVQAVQFMVNAKSGLLAYGVGVGKTASSILNVSYALDNNLANYPLFVVPLPTYAKWKMEIQGGIVEKYVVTFQRDGETMQDFFETKRKANKFIKQYGGSVKKRVHTEKGLLPHLPKIVDLGNMNWEEFVKDNIKEYTAEEERELQLLDEGIDYVKTLRKKYKSIGDIKVIKDEETEMLSIPTFNGFDENDEILRFFPMFQPQEFVKDYNSYQYRWMPNYKGEIEAKKTDKKKDPIAFLLYGFFQPEKIETASGLVTQKAYENFGLTHIRTQKRFDLGRYKDFPPNTIFIMTYQGLEYLGSEKRTVENTAELQAEGSLYAKMFNEISQGDKLEDAIAGGKLPKLAENISNELFGSPTKGKVFLKDLGIDYLVVDESHFFKNVFTVAKGRPNFIDGQMRGRGKRKYDSLSKGQQPSARSLRMYALTRYVQHEYMKRQNLNGLYPKVSSNVCHLTATPFTNSPMEVYSMMALTNYDFLKYAKMQYIEDFFDAFMKTEFALRFRAGKITKEQVLVGYNNIPQMRNIISYLMDYKSGQDANIKRPDKVILPSSDWGVDTTMRPTDEQERLMSDIKAYIRGRKTLEEVCGDMEDEDISVDDMSETELLDYLYNSDDEKAIEKFSAIDELTEAQLQELKNVVSKILEKDEEVKQEDLSKSEMALFRFYKGMTYIRQATLSPYLIQCRKAKGDEPTYREYVESSPKLLYSVKAIKSTHDYEDANNIKRTGCVIYMNIAVDPKARVPIGEPIGRDAKGRPIYSEYKTVKWNSGGFDKIKQYMVNVLGYQESEIVMVKGGMSNPDKEFAKNKFLSGSATVLIGSATISTGVDLQNNASSLFLCSFDFNPTDNEQISGRIHRQGNCRDKVRIVYPMISDSVDPIIFQLLQEKTARINEIWDREGAKSTLDLEDFDPAQLQEQLIKDPEDRVEMWFERESDRLKDELSELEQKQTILRNAYQTYDTYITNMPLVRYALTVIDAYKKYATQQEGIEVTKERIQEIMETDFEPIVREIKNKKGEVTGTEVVETTEEQQVKAINKIKKERYDYANDPEGRYVPKDYSDVEPDDLMKKVVYEITKSGSWFIQQKDNYSIINEFIRERYNDWYYGNYITQEEQEELTRQRDEAEQEQLQASSDIDVANDRLEEIRQLFQTTFDENAKKEIQNRIKNQEIEIKRLDGIYQAKKDIVDSINSKLDNLVNGVVMRFDSSFDSIIPKDVAREWLGAWRDMRQKRKVLASWGLNPENVSVARRELSSEMSEVELKLSNLEREKSTKFEQFQREYEESMTIAPTIDEMVESFASINADFLGEKARLECFDIDKTPTVEELPEIEVIEEDDDFEEEVIEREEEEIEGEDESDIEALKDDFWDKLWDYLEANNLEVDEDLMVAFIDEKWSEKLNDDKNINAYLKYIETSEAEEEEEPEKELDSKIDEYLSDIEGYEILLELNSDEKQREEYLDDINGYLILMELEGADESLIEEIKTKFEL
jgi:hypothetical protein